LDDFKKLRNQNALEKHIEKKENKNKKYYCLVVMGWGIIKKNSLPILAKVMVSLSKLRLKPEMSRLI